MATNKVDVDPRVWVELSNPKWVKINLGSSASFTNIESSQCRNNTTRVREALLHEADSTATKS